MPANREARLLARQALDPPNFLQTFQHPEGEAQAGVRDDQGGDLGRLRRAGPLILSVDRDASSFRLFIKAIGPGTRSLAALAVGEVAQCLGPLGKPFTPPGPGEEALLVAGGYGIAPFRLFAEGLRGRAHVFYGGRTARDLQLRDLFAPLGVPLHAATEDGHSHGQVTAPLLGHLEAQKGPVRLYACGPDAMLHAVARLAQERGLPAEVSLDPWMGCGIGTCLGCVVFTQDATEAKPRYRCACTEGPVFDAARVVWPGEESSRRRREAAAAP
jgi:dihydroorotate dehydrogenase electron transfer subunit